MKRKKQKKGEPSAVLKSLMNPLFRQQVVPSGKGKGSYNRKNSRKFDESSRVDTAVVYTREGFYMVLSAKRRA